MMIKLEKDASLIYTVNHEEYAKFIADLKSSSRHEIGELTQDFLNLELHPNTRDLAGLAAMVNGEKEKGGVDLSQQFWLLEYVLLCRAASEKTGYRGAIFYRKENQERHGQLIIAHGGTKFEPGDWQADYDGVVNNRLTPQINSACTFGLNFVQKFSTGSGTPPLKVSITGHSLGGWLAQICTFALKYLHLNETTFELPANNFPSENFHPHCEVFDSPGAFEIIQGLSSLKQFRVLKLKTKPHFGLDITNFVFTPNGVNVVNNHIGDMFLLPLDDDIITGNGGKPSSFLTRQNFTFTKTTHAMARFVRELISNPNPRLVRVEEWILILFRNWDTKKHVYLDKHVNILSLLGSSVKHLFTTKWSQTTKEYDDFMKSALPVGTSSGEEGLKINLHTLSAGAQEVVELLKTVNIWQTYLGGNGGTLRNPNLEILQSLVEIVARSPTRNPILIPSQNYFVMLQNAGLALSRIAEMCGKLENFSVAQIRSCSDRYRDAIQDKFISLEFEEGQEPVTWRDEYRHGNRNLLKLFCLKICVLVETEKGGLSRKNTLILKYGDVNFTNLASPPDGVKFIFVDCINHLSDKIEQKPSIPDCQVTFIIHDPTGTTNNNNNWTNLRIADSSFPEILNQSINLQGVPVKLSEFLNSASGCQEILQCLFNDPDKLYVVLQKRAKLDIGTLPASIFDNVNIYVEPERTFNSMEEAVQIFKVILEGFELPGVILFYEEDGFPDFAKFLQNSLQNYDLKYFILTSDEDPVASFQQYCKNHSETVVELVACRSQGNSLDWKLHYNPDLYRTREILPPAIDTRGLHKWGKDAPVNFKIAAGPGAETWEEVLSINCLLIPDKDNLLENLGLSQRSDLDPANIKSVHLKPGTGGSCELVLHFIDSQPALVIQLEGKQPIHENGIFPDGGSTERFLMCISDSPGMGKSFTMMTMCANILQTSQNNYWAWVFFIQLRDLTGFDRLAKSLLERLDEDNVPETYLELDSIVPFLAQNLKLDSISSIAFRAMLTGHNSSKIFLILDGFDELANSNKQLVSRVLKGLRINSSVNIAMSTRTRDNLLVETSLGIVSHHLLPLGQYEQFLYDIWKGVIRDEKDRLATYSSTLMRKVQNSFVTDNSNSFLGIPLHMKMLSVAFATPARNFSSGLINLDEAVPSQYSLRILIDQFIDTKYKIFFFNKLGLKDAGIWDDLRPSLTWKFERELEFLGGDMLEIGRDGWDALIWEIYRVERKNLQISEDDASREIYRIGLVQGSPKPEFLHRSIAESYVTNFIFKSFKQFSQDERRHGDGENGAFAQKLFVAGKSAVLEIGRRLIRSFLNELVKTDDQILSQLRDGSLPRIATRGVDDDILSCFYELVRLEHSSTDLFGFLANTFFNWGQTSRYILVLFALSGLSVIPMTQTTLEIVFMLIRSFRLQIGENSIDEIMESQPSSSNEFAIIKSILLYTPDNLAWYRFRADFKPFLLNKESAMSQFGPISKDLLGKEEVRDRLEERYGICGDEFETSVKFVDWLLEFMEILGKDLRAEISRRDA
ncbi:uncharacterized protein LOC118437264 [Folsomia candida]|uniref:NACHT domain-containing protein n=1 Tax=Folsomia candida TaxID=158441 RepID=A0A226F1H4_FOLCA|nr:uncharacterized protein LOC118437264 [Folsomia candida]XP_035712080.1 uncharacterized protein LOC118437264 [Folsomia candida]OXA63061.1 hypothetical protein Fcan01_00483 [Folsomia candida]